MKRLISLLVVFVLCLTISGCGRQEQLEKENQQLREQIEDLTFQIEELKNGADNLIIEIRSLYEQNKYDEVIEKAKLLHEKHNGVPQDIEAQKLVNQIISQCEEEERIRQEEAAKSKQDKLRGVIRVKRIITHTPNSAGGVDLDIHWVNNSDKTVKYIVFVVEPYNAVNDVVECDIRNTSVFRGKETGPIEKGNGNKPGYYWECAWYNSTISYAKITKIEIEYMDGTKVDIPNEDIQHIIY